MKYYLIIINLITFLAFYADKQKAKMGMDKVRTPENVLLTLSLMGGVFMGILAMYIFRHKTRKAKFTLSMPLIAAVWLYILGSNDRALMRDVFKELNFLLV